MNKDEKDIPQYSGHTENNTSTRATQCTSVKMKITSEDVKGCMMGSIRCKNEQNLYQDSVLETDQNNLPLENVSILSENIGQVKEREIKSQSEADNESLIIKITKKRETGKENKEVTSSSELVSKEDLSRSQVCSGNIYLTNLNFKHITTIRDSLVDKSSNGLHSQKKFISQKNTGLVNASRIQLQNSLKSESSLPEMLSGAGNDKRQYDDHSYVRRFCKWGNSEEKHTENRDSTFSLSEDSSSNLQLQMEELKNHVEDTDPNSLSAEVNSPNHWLQVMEKQILTEDESPLFPSTEVNSLNPGLQLTDEQNHDEGWWGFFTLMSIGNLLHKLPVKEAESIENNNRHLPPRNHLEKTSEVNDEMGWRKTSLDAWDSWRLISEVSTSALSLPVQSSNEQKSEFEKNENTGSGLSCE